MCVKLVSAFSLWVLKPRLLISFKYVFTFFFVFLVGILNLLLLSLYILDIHILPFYAVQTLSICMCVFLFLLYFKQDFFTANWDFVTEYGNWNDSKVIMSDLQIFSNICTTFPGSTSPSFLLSANEINLEAMDQSWKPYDTTTNWSESP